MSNVRLRNKGSVPMHWGEGYPSPGDILLAYFENDPEPYICRVENLDEMGGNLVELSLQRARVANPARYRDVVLFRLINTGGALKQVPITSWEALSLRLTEDEWYRFLGGDIYPSHREQLANRFRFPVSDGKGGYTRETIAFSLSREYEGP